MKTLILFFLLNIFVAHLFAQNKHAEKTVVAPATNKISDVSLNSESVLKANIFSPLLGYSQFAFEKSIANRRSLEFGLGIIGAGINLNLQPPAWGLGLDRFGVYRRRPGHRNQFGSFFEFGYKFIKPAKLFTKSRSDVNALHALDGSYIKPSFMFGAYGFNQFRDDSTLVTIRRQHRFGALMVNLGHEWVFEGRIVFELYGGMGAEIDNVKDEDDLYGHPFALAIAKDNPSVNFAFAAGFRFGFLLR